MPGARVQAASTDRAWPQAVAGSSLGADWVSGGVAGTRRPVAARHPRVRLPLLLVPTLLVRLPDRRSRQLRRANARGPGNTLSAACPAVVRRRGERVACLR